jgi:hypothetical protein
MAETIGINNSPTLRTQPSSVCATDFQAGVSFQNHALPMQGIVIAIFTDDRVDDNPVTGEALLAAQYGALRHERFMSRYDLF